VFFRNAILKVPYLIILSFKKQISENPKILNQNNTIINKRLDELYEKLIKGFNKTEYAITEYIQDYSKVFISGNIGIGVTSGTGDFAGGVHLSGTIDSWLQLGLFVNNQISQKNELGRWITGGQIRVYGDSWQVDGLVSALFGNHKKVKDWSGAREFGLGGSVRFGSSIIGLAGTILQEGDKNVIELPQYESISESYRSTSKNSLTYIIGLTGYNDLFPDANNSSTFEPFFKVALPLNPEF